LESGSWVDRTGILKVGSDKSSSVLAQLIGELELDSGVSINEQNFENMDSDRNLSSSRSTNNAPTDNWSSILPDFNTFEVMNDNGQKDRLVLYTDTNGDFRLVEVDLVNFSLNRDIVAIDKSSLPSRPDNFTAGTNSSTLRWMVAELPSGDILLTEYISAEENKDVSEEKSLNYRAAVYDTSANLLTSDSGVFDNESVVGDDEDGSQYQNWLIQYTSHGYTDSGDDAARTFCPTYWQAEDFGDDPSTDSAETVLVALEYDEAAGTFSTYKNRPGHQKGLTARQRTTSTSYQQGDRAYVFANISDEGNGYDSPEHNVLYGYFNLATFGFSTEINYSDLGTEDATEDIRRFNNQVLWETYTEDDNPDDEENIRHYWYIEDQNIYSNFSDPNNDGFPTFKTETLPYGVEAEFEYENEDGSILYNQKKAARIDGSSQDMTQFSEVHAQTGQEILQYNGEWYPYDWDNTGVTRKWLSSSSLTFSTSSLDVNLDVNTVVGHLFAYHNTFRVNDIFEKFESLLTSTVEITSDSGSTQNLATGTWVKYFDTPESLSIEISTDSFILSQESLNHYKLFYERADAT